MPHQANPQTQKKLPWTTKAVSTYYMAKEEIPAVVVIWTPGRRGVRCGSSSLRQAWSKHHWHGYKTRVYTHSLSSDLQGGGKTETKQKDLDSKHKQKNEIFSQNAQSDAMHLRRRVTKDPKTSVFCKQETLENHLRRRQEAAKRTDDAGRTERPAVYRPSGAALLYRAATH